MRKEVVKGFNMESIQKLSQQLGEALKQRHWVCATAESCTGGGVAAAITDIPGSSEWFDRAFVTYTNDAKQEMLGVTTTTLATFGAVSEPTVLEMATGVLERSHATISVAISGIAGPSGGSDEKPVGTVCFAWLDKFGWKRVETMHFLGGRTQVRAQAVYHAMQGFYDHLSDVN